MSTQNLKDIIQETLKGDVQKNALAFAAYLNTPDISIERQTTGYWADKIYFICNFKEKSLCYIAINEYEENQCFIWSDDSGSQWFNDFPLDEHTKHIAWKNVNICTNPNACGACPQKKGTPMTIFGKEYKSVCLTSFSFSNPDTETLACMKKLFDIRKNDIMNNA